MFVDADAKNFFPSFKEMGHAKRGFAGGCS